MSPQVVLRLYRLGIAIVCVLGPALLVGGAAAPVAAQGAPLAAAAAFVEVTPGSFELRLPSGAALLHPGGVDLVAVAPDGRADTLQLRFVGATPSPPQAALRQPGVVNRLLGDAPSRWQTGLPRWGSVHYTALYPGIDLGYEATARGLKGTFLVAAGADPAVIQWRYEGAAALEVDAAGDLVITTASGATVREAAPLAWSVEAGTGARAPVAAGFAVHGETVGFVLGDYTPTGVLVIDPLIGFSTYLGGAISERATGVVLDPGGSIYVSGWSVSANFPTTPGVVQPALGGNRDWFVAKFTPAGQLVFSTYIGGSGNDEAGRIALDSAGNLYVGGGAGPGFPIVNGFQTAHGGGSSDGALVKLNPAGTAILYSTYLGGSGTDYTSYLVVVAPDTVYVAGYTASADFPTRSPFQPAFAGIQDAVIARFDTTASGSASLVFSSYHGGSGSDVAWAATAAADGGVWFGGWTESAAMPVQSAFQAAFGGVRDGFLVRVSRSGVRQYASYFGGSASDAIYGLATDTAGNLYAAGPTASANFPTLNPFQAALNGTQDAFVTKFNPSASALLYSTYYGGSGFESARGLAVDRQGRAVIAGNVTSMDLPLRNPTQATHGGADNDGFIAIFEASGGSLLFATYAGGSGSDFLFDVALDRPGNPVAVGDTGSTNFPVVNAYQTALAGDLDAVVVRILHTWEAAAPSLFRGYTGGW